MIARFLTRLQQRPRAVVLGSTLVFVLALAAIAHLRVETDLFRLLPSRLPGLGEFLDASRTFGALDAVFGLFEAPRPDVAREYADAFAVEAARSPRVAHVLARLPREEIAARGAPLQALFFVPRDSLEKIRERLSPVGFPEAMDKARHALLSPVGARAAAWIQRDPLGLQAILAGGLAGLPRPSGLDPEGYWGRESSGRYRILVTVMPAAPPGDLAFSEALVADLRLAEERARHSISTVGAAGQLRAGFTGGHFVAVEESQSLRQDIAGTLVLSLLAVLGVFWAFFRRFRVVAALAACLVVSLAVGLGLLALYPGRLHAVTAGFAAVLCGLAVDYGIHLHNGLRHAPGGSLAEVYRVVGRSVTLGALTTAGAFLALCTSDFPGMREFGMSMVAGVLASLAVMSTLFVTLDRTGAPLPRDPEKLTRRWEGFLWRNRRSVLVGAALLWAIIGWLGWPRATFEPNLRRLAVAGETRQTQEAILDLFGNRLEPLVFRWHGTDLAQGLLAMASLKERAAAAAEVDHTETPLLFLPDPRRASAVSELLGGLDPERLCGELKTAASGVGLVPTAFTEACRGIADLTAEARVSPAEAVTRSLLPRDLAQAWEGRFVHSAGDTVDLAAYVYPSHRLTSPTEARRLAVRLGADDDAWEVSGIGLLTDPLRDLLAHDLAQSTLLACVVVGAVALVGLRSPLRGVLALLPAAAAAAATVGVMGMLGISLNPMNFVAVPLVLGLGIDDGLHLVTQAWARPDQSVAAVLAESGWAITCTTATTVAGFASLLAAHHGGLVSLGGLVCIGVTFSWIATVAVLPPLLRWSRGGDP